MRCENLSPVGSGARMLWGSAFAWGPEARAGRFGRGGRASGRFQRYSATAQGCRNSKGRREMPHRGRCRRSNSDARRAAALSSAEGDHPRYAPRRGMVASQSNCQRARPFRSAPHWAWRVRVWCGWNFRVASAFSSVMAMCVESCRGGGGSPIWGSRCSLRPGTRAGGVRWVQADGGGRGWARGSPPSRG